MPTPAQILRLGTGNGQNHFSLQIARDGAADFATLTLTQLAGGFDESPYFTAVTSGGVDRVQFRARADAPTTSGSSFARAELRELNEAGTANMKFDALVGEHILQGTTRIAHVPANDPDVVIAQLHNGDADRIAIRTQMFSSGEVVLGVRINGSIHATRFQDPWVPGSEFTWKIRLIDGTAEIYFNDMTTPVITSTALTQTSHPDGWYFKAGAYNQFNESATGATGLAVSATEYSQVELRSLSHWHTGWPAVGSTTETTGGTAVPGTMFIQSSSLAALPTTGAPWTALVAKSTADPGSGNLGALDQTHPMAVFSIALRWARDGGGLGRDYVINEIKAVMGTESSAGQPLNPYRTLGAYVMAADLVDMPGSTVGANGQTFDAWMQSWPNKVIPGQTNWNTVEKCSRTSGNNWGACARTSLLAVLLWLRKRGLQPSGHDRETLITQCLNWYKRFVGDTGVPNTFTATGAYQSNWAVSTYPGSQGVINPVSMTVRSGVTLDGANVEDASRSTFPDKNGAGKHYQYESLDSAMAFITLAINAGYTDAAGWGNNGVRRNYRYFIVNGLTAPDSDFHHFMWMQPTMANYLFSGLGFPIPTGYPADRAQRRMLTTHTDWLTSSGSTWLKVGGSTGGGGGVVTPPAPVVENPTVTDLSFTVNNQSILVSAIVAQGTAPISTYNFTFGDGTSTGPQSSPSASHAYAVTVPRTYAVRVDVVATDGGTASRSENSPTIFAPDEAPIARVTLDKTLLIGGGVVAYDMGASEDGNGDPLTYSANSGEGETKTTATGTFTYADVTERTDYTATFTVTGGGVTSAPVVRTVTVIPQVQANAIGAPYLVVNGQKIPLGGHDSAWSGVLLRLGNYRLWVDATGDLRIKNGPPASDTDGTVVGSQS